MEKLEPLCIAGGAANMGNSLVFPQNVNMELPYGPAIPIASYIHKRNEMLCPYQNLYMNAHNSIIHNSHKWNNKISNNWWMDKLIYLTNGILFNIKRNVAYDICCNIDKPLIKRFLSERSYHKGPYIVWFHLCEMARIGNSI